MKIKNVDVTPTQEPIKKVQGSITSNNNTRWGEIGGNIENQKDLMILVDEHVGKIDKEIEERKKSDKELNKRLTSLEETIPQQLEELEERVYGEIIPKIEEVDSKVKVKASSMYYDEPCYFGNKKLWYMVDTDEILDPSLSAEEIKQHLIKDKNTGKPMGYELGKGGGGGGGDTIVKINSVKWPTSIAYGSKCEIIVNWYSKDEEGKSTGSTGNFNVFLDEVNILNRQNVAQGNVTFDLTEYINNLPVGTHKVELKVTDNYGSYSRLINTVTTLSIGITSTFDGDSILSGRFNYTYIPTGTIEKKVHFIRDGVEIATDVVMTSGDQQTHVFSDWPHGSHTFKVYFTCNIDGNEVTSNELYYDLIYIVHGDNTPIISSVFTQDKEEQDVSFTIPYKVYNPVYLVSEVTLLVNDEVVQKLNVDRNKQFWQNKFSDIGNKKLQIKCGETVKTFNIEIYETEIPVQPVTQDLVLALNTIGRSNAEEHPEIWEDKERGISCSLTGFNFSSDGWLQDVEGNTVLRVTGNARVEIPYKPFKNDLKNLGKTIELEIATSSVMDYESVIMSCFTENRGFYLTPQLAKIKSQQSELQTQYKEEEHIRLTFVIEKKVETRIIYMYVNGIMCGAVQYPESDEFRQLTPVNISIGSSDATIDIYNIRIYDNNLNRKQVVNNWIADTQNKILKKQRYLHNDNYNEIGEIVIEKLPDDLPHIIWGIDPLPLYKGDKRPGNAEYVDPQDDTRNFTSTDATYNVQGTSSAVYPVKNIRIKYKKNKDWPTTNFTWKNKDGETISGFAITTPKKEGDPLGIPDNYFTYKVDYASSEGANNVELTRLYNDACRSKAILTPPQKYHLNKEGVDDHESVRVGIDGFPIIAFNKNSSGKVSFCTKANFNNDKANESVYGFIDGDESWEITNNSSAEGIFKKGVTPETFSNAFEIRFPDEDGYSDLSKLGPMTAWVASTDPEQATGNPIEPVQFTYEVVKRSEDGTYSRITVTSPVFTNDTTEYRLIKFKAELKDWFNVDSTVFYYIYTLLFLMIDSRAKNAFPTYFAERKPGDGGNRWFWLPYDMDTAIGINNEGKLVFDYNLEDTDKTPGGDNIFNGQDSVMWNNLRKMFDGEIGEMYSGFRTTGGLLSYEEVESRFEAHQSKWSESIFNEDSFEKYVKVLRDTKENYLEMLQGSKAEQRKWWLYNRFRYLDSKYVAGTTKDDMLQFRAQVQSGVEKPDIVITPYADIYATVSYRNGDNGTRSVRAPRGVPTAVPNPTTKEESETDQETYIYSASQIKYIGDLSGFWPSTVKIAKATRLQELKVGDSSPDYENKNLKELELGNNTLLKKIDIRNCTELAIPVNAGNCTNLEEAYFDNTKITSLTLPSSGILKTLHLPGTITNLTITNQPLLNDLKLDLDPESNLITTLILENIPFDKLTTLDAENIIMHMPDGGVVRLIGFKKNVSSVEEIDLFYNKLDKMTCPGGTPGTDKPEVKGTINIPNISWSEWNRLTNRYPNIDIVCPSIICKVIFKNEGEVFGIQNVIKGQDASDPGIPTKEPNNQFRYTFKEWDKSYKNVQTDLEINSVYNEIIQEYLFHFDPQTTLVDPIPDEKVAYGNLLPKPKDPEIPGTVFDGWFYDQAAQEEFHFEIPVTGPFIKGPDDKPLPITLYGKWTDENNPVVNITILDFEKIKFNITDNIAVIGYAITDSDVEPTEWTYITPTSSYDGNYTVTKSGPCYVWGLDGSGRTGKAFVNVYEIVKDLGLGSTLTITNNDSIVNNFSIQGNELKFVAETDSHYENLKLFIDGEEVEQGYTQVIYSNITAKTTCTPKSYTVKFNMMGKGKQEPDQTIVYNNLVTKPKNQYETGYVMDGWYKEEGLENKWNFDVDRVSENTTLYAKWIVYVAPTRITVIIDENKNFTCNWNQSEANGVLIDWGDGTTGTVNHSGYVSLSHTYTHTGKLYINITCKSGTHFLGGGSYSSQVVTPIENVEEVDFAYNLTHPGEYSFRGATNLEHIILTDYMDYVSMSSFMGCSNVTELIIPNNITSLEKGCFSGCTGLTGKQTISKNVTKIGENAFYDCSGITEFELPENLETIGDSCFYGCSSLLTLSIPPKVKTLSTTMLGASGIKYIDIPETVEQLGYRMFAACNNLEKVILRNKELITKESFDLCPKLKTAGPIGGNYNIEFAWDNILPDSAFEYSWLSSDLVSVTLPDSIKIIGNRAFYYCQNLQFINLPSGLTKLGDNVFERCSSLLGTPREIGGVTNYYFTIPSTCTYIGKNIFYRCSGLRNVELYNKFVLDGCKVNSYLLSWFKECEQSLELIISKSFISDEEIRNAYGQCWNFYDNGQELIYHKDL